MSIYLSKQTLLPIGLRSPSSRDDGLLRRLVHAASHRMQRRRTITELHDLDDRLLADIGLRRDDIYRVAKQSETREHQMALQTTVVRPAATQQVA